MGTMTMQPNESDSYPSEPFNALSEMDQAREVGDNWYEARVSPLPTPVDEHAGLPTKVANKEKTEEQVTPAQAPAQAPATSHHSHSQSFDEERIPTWIPNHLPEGHYHHDHAGPPHHVHPHHSSPQHQHSRENTTASTSTSTGSGPGNHPAAADHKHVSSGHDNSVSEGQGHRHEHEHERKHEHKHEDVHVGDDKKTEEKKGTPTGTPPKSRRASMQWWPEPENIAEHEWVDNYRKTGSGFGSESVLSEDAELTLGDM